MTPVFMPPLRLGKDPYFIVKSQRVTLGDSEPSSARRFRASRRKTESPSYPGGVRDMFFQWIFQVLVIGGRDYITPQKAIYKWYISGIYCQLGDYMPPTTF